MTYDFAIVSLITFLVMMVYLEKGRVPVILKKGSFLKIIPLLLLFLAVMLTFSALTHILHFSVIATVMSSCLLLWRFKERVEHWDKV